MIREFFYVGLGHRVIPTCLGSGALASVVDHPPTLSSSEDGKFLAKRLSVLLSYATGVVAADSSVFVDFDTLPSSTAPLGQTLSFLLGDGARPLRAALIGEVSKHPDENILHVPRAVYVSWLPIRPHPRRAPYPICYPTFVLPDIGAANGPYPASLLALLQVSNAADLVLRRTTRQAVARAKDALRPPPPPLPFLPRLPSLPLPVPQSVVDALSPRLTVEEVGRTGKPREGLSGCPLGQISKLPPRMAEAGEGW